MIKEVCISVERVATLPSWVLRLQILWIDEVLKVILDDSFDLLWFDKKPVKWKCELSAS